MESLVLYYRGRPVRELALGPRPVAIGGAPHCDIVLADPGLADRELLVHAVGGTVVTYDLRPSGRSREPRVLPRETPLALGTDHAIVRADASGDPGGGHERTERLLRDEAGAEGLVLLVGHGREARRVPLRGRPLAVGSGPDNDVVLLDRAVSARHCRLDPTPTGCLVRDLRSRNGTWLDGYRVDRAELRAGAVLRVGRTDLRLVRRAGSAPGSALVAESTAVLAEVERAARLPYPVLLVGESGVGKEGLAQALHTSGPRGRGPFVALNAGAFPAQLAESELFGHEKGAFTGAASTHRGAFEQADGGTLFLDEIGELPLELQARLLRVLETWEVRRVGGESAFRVDVRLVAATHRDLRRMVAEGTFRRDLYYRLGMLVVSVPPLRERREDILPLARAFLARMEPDVGSRALSAGAETLLMQHSWEGNARELRNVLCAAAVASPEGTVDGEAVARALALVTGGAVVATDRAGLAAAVERHRGNVTAAARALGIARSTLRDRLRPEE